MRGYESKSGNSYFHNGDFSGDVTWEIFEDGQPVSISIPFEDMKELVARWLVSKKISELEDMSADEILKGL